ncbi:MAG: hypothetical protein Q8P67_23820, partial [archaeon]|nr:hypothetical protein [archaeon]
MSTKGRSGEQVNNSNNNNNQSTAAFTPVRDTSGGGRDERWEEGKYTFSDVLWEHRYLFLSIPFLMMLVRGAQEYTWPETPATVVQHQPEAGSITYRYYCDGRVVEHVQVRSPPARAFERVMYRGGHSRPEGGDPEDQERLQPGDIIRIHINPR